MLFSTRIEKYLVSIITEYQRNKKTKKISHNVYRGRSSSISGYVENNFGLLIESLLEKDYKILIDYPISIINENSKNETYYPDIIISKNNQILGIIELKIDIGYSRLSIIEDLEKLVNYLKEKTRISINRGNETLTVSERIVYKIVIITSKNDHGKLNLINQKKLIVLMNNGIHPNDDKISNPNEYIKEIRKENANIKAWTELEEFLNSIKKIT